MKANRSKMFDYLEDIHKGKPFTYTDVVIAALIVAKKIASRDDYVYAMRGYYSSGFVKTDPYNKNRSGYFMKPSPRDKRFLEKTSDKLYIIKDISKIRIIGKENTQPELVFSDIDKIIEERYKQYKNVSETNEMQFNVNHQFYEVALSTIDKHHLVELCEIFNIPIKGKDRYRLAANLSKRIDRVKGVKLVASFE